MQEESQVDCSKIHSGICDLCYLENHIRFQQRTTVDIFVSHYVGFFLRSSSPDKMSLPVYFCKESQVFPLSLWNGEAIDHVFLSLIPKVL